jgi:peptidoglycan/LPS O-acetylase OafA/YrhL
MKPHLIVLDGLRGTAAISIVILHFQVSTFDSAHPNHQWLSHSYLAVDFFFCLSGYVIGYAYDERYGRMSQVEFLTARLIRLHPMVIMGVVIGLLTYVFDPFNGGPKLVPWLEVQSAPAWKLAACAIAGLFMVPSWGLPNRADAYFSLNVPCWSLLWEYLANIVYAFALWRITKAALLLVAVLGAIGVVWSAYKTGLLVLGFAWGQMTYALVRTVYSFCIGLWLYRCRAVVRSRFGFVTLSVVMVLVFMFPYTRLNWLYESLVVLLLFPLIVVAGAGAATSERVAKVCQLFGRISYPIYIIHSGFAWIFANYFWTHRVETKLSPWLIALFTGLVVLLSYGVLILYDEPMRRRLSARRTELRAVSRTNLDISGQPVGNLCLARVMRFLAKTQGDR